VTAPAVPAVDSVPRSAKWFVGVILAALLIPGLIGFDAWPLTGWRLFSVSRGASRVHWVVQAVDGDGDVRTVSLEDLPLRYRHAEWPMADLPGASEQRREAVCTALADAVARRYPSTVEVNIAQDHERMLQQNGEWTVTHDPEVFHTCRPESAA
jgi:hypothetical protein